MSSFINGIRINNIQNDVNDLKSAVAALETGAGTGNINFNLDMNNHSILETASIQFQDSSSFSNANYLKLSGTTASVDMNQQDITNVKTLAASEVMIDESSLVVQNSNLLFNTNQVITDAYLNDNGYLHNPILADLNLNGHNITTCSQVYVMNGIVMSNNENQETTTLTTTDGNTLQFGTETLLTSNNFNDNVTSITLGTLTFTKPNVVGEFTLPVNINSADRLQINNNQVVIDVDLQDYLTNADIDTYMDTTQFPKLSIGTNELTPSNTDVLLNGKVIITEENIGDYEQNTTNFTESITINGSVLTTSAGNLQVNDSTIITEANINTTAINPLIASSNVVPSSNVLASYANALMFGSNKVLTTTTLFTQDDAIGQASNANFDYIPSVYRRYFFKNNMTLSGDSAVMPIVMCQNPIQYLDAWILIVSQGSNDEGFYSVYKLEACVSSYGNNQYQILTQSHQVLFDNEGANGITGIALTASGSTINLTLNTLETKNVNIFLNYQYKF